MAGIATADSLQRSRVADRQVSRGVTNVIDKSVVIKGELIGHGNLTIEGRFEGRIELRDNMLTVGPNGTIKAELLFAKSVDILGRVAGKIAAIDVVRIRENGSVDGDITAPRIAIARGAHFHGSVDMRRNNVEAKLRQPTTDRAPAQPGIKVHDMDRMKDGDDDKADLPPWNKPIAHDFWTSPTLDDLARVQNVRPMENVRSLFGTWPGDENDDFEAAIEELRHSGMARNGRS